MCFHLMILEIVGKLSFDIRISFKSLGWPQSTANIGTCYPALGWPQLVANSGQGCHSGVFTVGFEHISHFALVFLLLALNI